jgi:hypothetical protein
MRGALHIEFNVEDPSWQARDARNALQPAMTSLANLATLVEVLNDKVLPALCLDEATLDKLTELASRAKQDLVDTERQLENLRVLCTSLFDEIHTQ